MSQKVPEGPSCLWVSPGVTLPLSAELSYTSVSRLTSCLLLMKSACFDRFKKRVLIQHLETALAELEEDKAPCSQLPNDHGR